MIAYLLGEMTPPPITEASHPIHKWRHGIIGMLLDYWQKVSPQLDCPARNLRSTDESKRDPRPCFGCVDAQVVYCIVKNARSEHTIRKYLPTLR